MALLPLALVLASVAQETPPTEPTADPADPTADPAGDLPILAMPTIATYVEAPYPPEAEAAGLEAVVKLLIEIDETGKVLNAEVVVPAGHGFDEAALAAARQIVFTPAMTAEGPVPVAFEFDYGFTLRAAPPDTPDLPPPPVNLDGTIREMGTRRYLEGITVVVDGVTGPDGEDLTATTDANGRFELRGVPVGDWVLRVLSPAHVPLEQSIEILEGEATTAALWIRAIEYRENEAVGIYKKDEQEVTRRTITIDEVRRVPGTFGDPVKVVQTLPGAARSPFGTGFLVIRGSNPEDTGVYVDGVRIPIIYHLTGTTSVLSPDLIEAVDYLPGGYGVQYGRSMGGVVDIRTTPKFSEERLVWGTDILDSQVYYQGNVGQHDQHGIAIAGRRSYIDAFLPLFMPGDFTIRPRYWDAQVKWIPDLGDDQRLSVFYYGFDDVLRVYTPDDLAQGTDQDTQGDLYTQYATQRVVVQYERVVSDAFRFRLSPSIGIDFTRNEFGPFRLDSWNNIAQLRAEAIYAPAPSHEIVTGVDFIGGSWRFEFHSPFRWGDLDALDEREEVFLDGRGTGWSPDVYVKANVRPLADRERWLVSPGLRVQLSTFTYRGTITGGDTPPPYSIGASDPRLLTRFELVRGLTLKGGTGWYMEPPQPYQLVGVGTSAPETYYQRAWSSSVGVEHQVTPAVQWDLELFYKDMDELVVFVEDAGGAWGGRGDNPFQNSGRGSAYGAEIIVRHAKTGPFFGWVSYTYSRARRQDCPDCDPYNFEFDQPHIFSAQGGYDLPRDFSLSAQVQAVSGNPETTYDAGVYDVDGDYYNCFQISEDGAERLPMYFQSSVRADRLWTFKKWQMSTYVDLMNIVKGVNPEFTLYSYDCSEKAYVRGLPFIPNIGVEAKFYP